MYRSKNQLGAVKRMDNVTHIDSQFLTSITEQSGLYYIKAIDMNTKTKRCFKATTIFSSLGTISTTKFALELSRTFDREIRLLSTPSSRFLLYTPPTTKTVRIIPLANANISLRLNDATPVVGGCIFPVSNWLIEAVIPAYVQKLQFAMRALRFCSARCL